MFSLLFTVYCIGCVVFGAILIVHSCIYNTLPKKFYKWMLVFFPATFAIGLTGFVWFTVGYYLTGKLED
ncbi:hypothetical protein VPBG_00225 [Vibrio phage helene 12B3]|uniref:hypothetical protein n=1 Tax=Vibrio phage helene 12B3 TaxID=573173 RepID=UPI0002C14BFB|nr:hypothetical protein VPBG_00225 [Vibrio phage helene 12B3]YP_009223094.1 hypothetical protein VPLG_00245 [Vibrio phage eugene 12A10]AGG57997.1 hypothetical protein VPBG_00225 [Vibrio phage helene 12B3]AGN51684.1 hypothetical protein VPLG_00245 [Vibrio phage eugene 12A10]